MRRMDLDQVVAALKQPIEDFVGETRVRIALLINRSGQVLGQYGFTRKYEVVNVASLAAAANAAAAALAQLTGAERWTHLHHGGATRQMFSAPLRTPAEDQSKSIPTLHAVARNGENGWIALLHRHAETVAKDES